MNARFTDVEYAAIVAVANRADLSPPAYVGTAANGTETRAGPGTATAGWAADR